MLARILIAEDDDNMRFMLQDSLEMAGYSITLLQADDELLSLWDDPVLTPALRWGI